MSSDSTSQPSQPQSGNQISNMINDMGKDFQAVKPLMQFSSLVNIPPGHLVLGGSALVMMCIVFGFFSDILTALVGLLYPAYMSFKAIETKEEDDDVQWLTYWVVFSFLHVTDGALSMLLKFFPFYYPLKVIFYVYLFHPKTKGALFIYSTFLAPYLKSKEQKIDDLIDKGKDAVNQRVLHKL